MQVEENRALRETETAQVSNAATTYRFECTACGRRDAQYRAQCPGCRGWDTFGRISATRSQGDAYAGVVRCTSARLPKVKRLPCGLAWFDTALGGGIAVPQRVLLGGSEGAGKSRLLLQAAHGWASRKQRVLYVTGEMAVDQTRQAAAELGALHGNILLTATVELQALIELIKRVKPGVLLVDSLNAMHDSSRRGDPGSNGQLKACLDALGSLCVQRKVPSVYLCHLNGKDAISGPRWISHEVDATAMLISGKDNSRTFTVRKNRSGPNTETKLRMSAKGLVA